MNVQGRQKHAQPEAEKALDEDDHGQKEERGPDRNTVDQREREQHDQCQQKVYQIREHNRKWQDVAGKVDPADQMAVADDRRHAAERRAHKKVPREQAGHEENRKLLDGIAKKKSEDERIDDRHQ